MSIYVCVFDDDGNRRRPHPDELESRLATVLTSYGQVLQMTNYHGRGRVHGQPHVSRASEEIRAERDNGY